MESAHSTNNTENQSYSFINRTYFNMEGSMYNYSLSMMVMMPLLTTFSGKVVDFVTWLLTHLGKIILGLLDIFVSKYVNRNEHLVEVEMFNCEASVISVTRFGKAMLWYLRQNNKRISRKYMFCEELFKANTRKKYDDDDDDDENNIEDDKLREKEELFLPIPIDFEKKLKDITKNEKDNHNYHYDNREDLNDEYDKKTEFNYLEGNIYVSMLKRSKMTMKTHTSVSVVIVFKTKDDLSHIEEYMTNIKNKYDEYIKNIKDRHYGRMFLMNAMSSTDTKNSITYTEYKYDKTQTFDNLFFSGKHKLISQLNTLENSEYFHKRGIKRKLALLIYGPPGVGKTCCVNAIANYTKRAIVSIPISRMKTNSDIEKILYCNNYNNDILENKDKIIEGKNRRDAIIMASLFY